MKLIITFVFIFNSLFLQVPMAFAQSRPGTTNSPGTDIQQALTSLEQMNRSIRYLDYNNQTISGAEAVALLAEGQRVYIISATANPTVIRLQRIPGSTSNPYSTTLLVEKMVGTHVASVTHFNVEMDPEAVPSIYRMIFGEPKFEQKSSTALREAQIGEYYHNGNDFSLQCNRALEAGTGREVKSVGLKLGPGGVGNLLVPLAMLGLLFMLQGTPSKKVLLVAALIPIIFFAMAGAMKYVSHQTGCRGDAK